MKKTILLILILFCFRNVYCQYNQPEVITSSGDFFKPNASSPSLSWTMGECISETYISTTNILTQGFQQNFEYIINIGIIENSDNDFTINIYPNPSTSFISVSIKPINKQICDYSIELYNLQGKKLYSENFNQNEFQLDMYHYPAGIYLLNLMTKENKILQNIKIEKHK